MGEYYKVLTITVVTDLTGEASDSDNHNNEKSSSTLSNAVTPNKHRKGDIQTTIENAIMRGYSSGRLQAHATILSNNWDTRNTFCDSTFIYHTMNSFAAPAYNTTTISPTLNMRDSDATKLPRVSGDNKDEKSFDNSNTHLSNGNNCAKVDDDES